MAQNLRTLVTLIVLLLTLALGGVADSANWQKITLQASWIGLVLVWLPEYRTGFATRRGIVAALIVLAGVGLGLAQLIPLPSSVWQSLPGREFVLQALEASNQAAVSMPLSLDPAATLLSLASLSCGVAFFLAGQKIPTGHQIYFAWCIIAFSMFSVILGLAQKFLGPQSGLFPYQDVGSLVAQGTFRNRNNFAGLLYCSLPFLFVLAITVLVRRKAHLLVVAAFCLIYLAMIIAGIAASASRSGMILAMVAVLCAAAMTRGVATGAGDYSRSPMSKVGFASALTLFLVFSQFGLASILRLAESDPLSDSRTLILRKSVAAAMAYFPWGSGFGTFVPIYMLKERPEDMIEGVFINHAHNDYIELFLEGGIVAAVLMAVALIWYLASARAVWKGVRIQPDHLMAKAGSIVVLLLLLHSLVEFPLRLPALMALFGLCVGFMAANLDGPPWRSRPPAQQAQAEPALPRRAPPRFKPRPS